MKTQTKKWLALLLALALTLALTACGGGNDSKPNQDSQQPAQEPAEPSTPPENANGKEDDQNAEGVLISEGMMPLDYAESFSIELFQGGYRMISAGTGGYQYLVVPEGAAVPEDLDENVKVLQKPINRVYMASTGMESLVDAIGGLENTPLVGTDINGWYLENVIAAMEDGSIQFGGKYSEPDFEILTDKEIQLHINTTMIDSKPEILEKFDELGIPSLVEDSSKERHPLARVEWVKLLGVLFDLEDEADRYFEEQKQLMDDATAPEPLGRTVAMGYVSTDGEKCYARNGGDYIAQMIGLAGGSYVCADMEPESGGNSNMTFEEWYVKFKVADCLFYMNFAAKFYTMEEMIESNPLFADFAAVKSGNVWITSPDFTQSTAAIASIVVDMNTILSSDDPGSVTTDHLIKLS